MHSFGEDIGELHHRELARYRWGMYRIVLSKASAYSDQKFFLKVLQGLSQGAGVWATETEFRAFVSLVHETVHYQQDIGTGLGHWDYLARRNFKYEMLGAYRDWTWLGGDDRRAQAMAGLDALGQSSLFNVYPRRARQAREWLSSAMSGYENHSDEECDTWTVPRILELDAALNTWTMIRDLKVSPQGAAVTHRLDEIFNPFVMADEYSEAFRILASVFMNTTDPAASPQVRVEQTLNGLDTLGSLFLDIALAYPPPSYFSNDPGRRWHYEPGIRLVRVLRHAQRLQKTDLASHVDRLVTLDESTRHTEEFDYPPVTQIYADWIAYIDALHWEDPILAWRRELCQTRLDNPSALAYRPFGNFVLFDLPLFVDLPSGDGFVYGTNRLILQGTDLHGGLFQNERDLSLIELFLGLHEAVLVSDDEQPLQRAAAVVQDHLRPKDAADVQGVQDPDRAQAGGI